MKNFMKRIISLICAISLAIIPVPVMAEEGAKVVAGTASGYAGNTVYIDITAENLVNLGSLDVDVFYRANVFELCYVSEEYIDGANIEINDSTPGRIKLSMAATRPIDGDHRLMTIGLTIKDGAAAGDYPINVAVEDAYDFVNLNAVSIGREDGKITVLKSPEYTPTADFYCSVSDSWLEEGDETTITYYSYWHYDMASGIFEFSFDPELFEYVDSGVYNSMKTNDFIWADNGKNPGYVRAAYSSSTAVGYNDLFFITLRAIKDCDASSSVLMKASSLYAQDLSSINGNERSCSINITKKYVEPEEPDYADFWVEVQENIIEGKEFEAVAKLSGDFSIAAADFTVSYNSEDFECVSVTAHPDVSENGGMVVINSKYSSGNIKFSFVNEDGAKAEQKLVVIKLRPIKTGEYSSSITTSGKSVYDEKYKLVTLDYLETPVNVSVKSIAGIEISKLPEKTNYIRGEELDVFGGKILVIYNNGTEEEIDITAEMISGFDNTVIGESVLTVTYGGFTDEYSISIKEEQLVKVEMTAEPDKKEYLEFKDALDVMGGKLSLTYDNGSVKVIDITAEMVSGFDNTVVGKQTLTISYEGYSFSYEIEVVAKTLIDIKVTTEPTKVEYLEAKDVLDVTGGKLTLYFNNDTTEVIDITA
ncbi:MAG: bacterial Ig-like domain-containing protein, partial [Oscillospiraceae bacterium]|nr:bacterial Ig-like domain-containing protein [Oscillospiraceae bacterium]